MIINEGHRQMDDVGFARFSAREVAKRIGYAIGTLYNVYGSYDRLILAINARTVALLTDALERALARGGDARMDSLVRGYFAFAQAHPKSWAAIYDHRLPPGASLPDWYADALAALTGIVDAEVARALPPHRRDEASALALSLLAVVHGHCELAVNGTFARLGETDPLRAALARVREAMSAAQ